MNIHIDNSFKYYTCLKQFFLKYIVKYFIIILVLLKWAKIDSELILSA